MHQMANKHVKRCSNTINYWVNTTKSHNKIPPHTQTRIAVIEVFHNTKFG